MTIKKEYLSTVDGKNFATKEDALNYLIENFIEEVEEDDGIEEIKTYLENEIPNFIFDVRKRPFTEDDVGWGLDDKAWLDGKEIIIVDVTSKNYELINMHFFIKDTYEYEHEWHNEFKELKDAVRFYKRFLLGAGNFRTSVLDTLKKYDRNVVDCEITKIRQSGGTADSFNEYHYNIIYHDGKVNKGGYIELDTYDLLSDEDLSKEIKSYTKRLSGYYLTEIEGEVTTGTPKYCNDHSIWYEIEGVSIDAFARRAKKLEIEILEEE